MRLIPMSAYQMAWSLDLKAAPTAIRHTNTTADVSGNGNIGQLISMSTTTSPTAGKIGQALKFDGSSSYVDTVDNALNVTGDITVSAWLKLNNKAGVYVPVSKYDIEAFQEMEIMVGCWQQFPAVKFRLADELAREYTIPPATP